jgi:hypothetical protein
MEKERRGAGSAGAVPVNFRYLTPALELAYVTRAGNNMAELAVTFAETDRITGACSRIFARGPNGEISLSFRRTSKVPSDGRMFHTPDLGHFPLYKVNRFHGLPSSVRQAGGWFIAMRGERINLRVYTSIEC